MNYHGEELVATWFQIPMRGNEDVDAYGVPWKVLEFQIPMRGNELLRAPREHLLDNLFQIPMRGNEPLHPRIPQPSSTVSNPHEG